jgi:hypothetical protein
MYWLTLCCSTGTHCLGKMIYHQIWMASPGLTICPPPDIFWWLAKENDNNWPADGGPQGDCGGALESPWSLSPRHRIGSNAVAQVLRQSAQWTSFDSKPVVVCLHLYHTCQRLPLLCLFFNLLHLCLSLSHLKSVGNWFRLVDPLPYYIIQSCSSNELIEVDLLFYKSGDKNLRIQHPPTHRNQHIKFTACPV